MNLPISLAALDTTKIPSVAEQWESKTSGMRDFSIVVGAALLVSLGIFCWAVFIRKPRRQRSPHYGGRESERGMLLTDADKKPRRRSWFKSGRRRHRKRRERPRNPTLADTGGLPPIREDKPVDPTF